MEQLGLRTGPAAFSLKPSCQRCWHALLTDLQTPALPTVFPCANELVPESRKLLRNDLKITDRQSERESGQTFLSALEELLLPPTMTSARLA